MPLDREHAAFSVLDHLDESILSSAHRLKVMSNQLDALVVDRIHLELSAAEKPCEEGLGLEEDTVNGFVASARLGVSDALRTAKVLAKRPTERNVHQLGASTDSKDGDPTLESGGDECELTSVALGINVGRPLLWTRAVVVRRDVAAASEEQPVEAHYGAPWPSLEARWDEQWKATRLQHRGDVLMRDRVESPTAVCLAPDADPDCGRRLADQMLSRGRDECHVDTLYSHFKDSFARCSVEVGSRGDCRDWRQ